MEFLNYSTILQLSVTVDSFGGVACKQLYFKTGFTKGKLMCLALGDEDPAMLFEQRTEYTTVDTTNSVFVSQASKLSRDMIRKSGFKIVLDKDKADKIVVPHIYPPERMTANMVFYSEKYGTVVVVKAKRTSDYISAPFTEKETQNILNSVKHWIENNVGVGETTFYMRGSADSFNVYFLKKCDEYPDLLNGYDTGRGKYVSEIKFPLVPNSTMDLDTMEILARCRDKNIFEKMIIGTDWQHYPLCMNLTLNTYNGYIPRTPAMAVLLNAIDYDDFRYSDPDEWGRNRIIQPDDWNLAQRWLMRRLDLDEEKGGFVPHNNRIFTDVLGRYTGRWYKWAQHKVCVKPLFIKEPTPYEQLREMIQIS